MKPNVLPPMSTRSLLCLHVLDVHGEPLTTSAIAAETKRLGMDMGAGSVATSSVYAAMISPHKAGYVNNKVEVARGCDGRRYVWTITAHGRRCIRDFRLALALPA